MNVGEIFEVTLLWWMLVCYKYFEKRDIGTTESFLGNVLQV